jgi:hypothetical protein
LIGGRPSAVAREKRCGKVEVKAQIKVEVGANPDLLYSLVLTLTSLNIDRAGLGTRGS